MGVIKQGILGGFSGKVAGVVGSSWKGIAVIKSLPLSVANPNTTGQQAQRGAMSQIVLVSRLLLATIIQPLWNPFSQKMSGYNAFVKENIAAFTTAGLTVFADFFSQRGSLIGVEITSVTPSSISSQLDVAWTVNTGVADGEALDRMSMVVYNATQDVWLTRVSPEVRADGLIEWNAMALTTGDVLHIYLGCRRENYSKVSDSTYATAVCP